ncbi:prolyl oligopeptidase family serine peptidase [soil metagenome]
MLLLLCLGMAGCARVPRPSAVELREAQAHRLSYPETRRSTTVDLLHGEPITDPYRWLEQLDAPQVRDWIRTQNDVTQAMLRHLPGRARITARLNELSSHERVRVPWIVAGRVFYTANDGQQAQPVLYTAAEGGARRIVLDPNALWPDGSVGVGGYAISPQGRWLAYTASRGGADYGTTHVRNITTGSEAADTVRGIWGSPCWTEDEQGFFYIGSPAPQTGQPPAIARITKQLRYHRLGTPEPDDRLLGEWTENYRWAWCMPSDDGRRMVVVAERGAEAEAYVMDLGDSRRPNIGAPLRRLLAEHPTVAPFGLIGTTLYARTHHDAPRGRIITLDVSDPAAAPGTLVPELDAVINRAAVVGDVLVVSTLKDVVSRLMVFTLTGTQAAEVPLPGQGAVGWLGGAIGGPELYFEFSSFVTPTTVYRYDARTGRVEPFRAPALSWDASSYESRQVFFTSRDGTRVPMFIVARRGTPLDGERPVLLTGYGGYGYSYLPIYSAGAALWLELGGVYAVANVRGGGEYGIEWHRAGSRERKQNSYDDFVAAAEYLITAGWTSPARLAIEGYSNGGLLVGVMITQRPDLFAAAVGGAGHYDMLRYHQFTVGAGWIPEFGLPEDSSDFRVLRAYSPLHNVREGSCYPATLLLTGENDDRVVPSHSYKFAAALQTAQTCKRPILLRVAPAASHGYASREEHLTESTDKLLFLAAQLRLELH